MGTLEILTVSTIISLAFFISVRVYIVEVNKQLKELDQSIISLNNFRSRIEVVRVYKTDWIKLQLDYLVKIEGAKKIEVGFSVNEIMHAEYFPEYLNSWYDCKVIFNEKLLNYEIKIIE